MRYLDKDGTRRVLTEDQARYMRRIKAGPLPQGVPGLTQTQSVQILHRRGLIELDERGFSWLASGLTALGNGVLTRWNRLNPRE